MTKTAYAQHPSISERDICTRCNGAGRVTADIRRRNVSDICYRCGGSGVSEKVLGKLQVDVLTLGQRVIVRGELCEITAIFSSIPGILYSDVQTHATKILPQAPPFTREPETYYVVNYRVPHHRVRDWGTTFEGDVCRPHQMIPVPA